MKFNWNRNINFSKSDRAVLLMITLILAILYVYNFIYNPKIKYEPSTVDLESVLTEINAKDDSTDREKFKSLLNNGFKSKSKYPPVQYFKFDPNQIDSLQWLKLGLKPWVVKSLLKQRRGGWKYYDCDKLRDLYNLPDSVYRKIRPYCHITPRKIKNQTKYQKKTSPAKSKISIEYSSFDPNTLDSIGWLKLGLESWMVRTIMKQRRNGWTYYSCDKLKDIYKLPDNVYQKIRPYCSIPEEEKTTKSRKNEGVIYLNTASLEELQSLRGIGTYYAQKIQEFRKELGGFHSVNQLTDIYGIEKEVIENNKKRLHATGIEKQLSLNAPQDSLSKHPYIRYKLAKHISRYRQQHGNFHNVEDLKKLIVVSDSIYNKVYPYLKI